MRVLRRGSTAAALLLLFSHLGGPVSASAGPPEPVDEPRLVPTLSPSFAPWTCQTKQSGPVCKGEWHITFGWEPFDFGCGDTPLWISGRSDRHQTRYYNEDYLNVHREFRTNDIDSLSTSPTGPAMATISANVRFGGSFAVPGDDATRTNITHGVPWDIRSINGPAVWRAVGTMVELPGRVGTFTGHVTAGSTTTRYADAPLPDVLSDDTFVEMVCQAVLGPDWT